MRLFLLLISFFLFFSSCTETKQNITFQSENIMIEQEIISDSTIVLKYLPYKDSIENSTMNKPLAFSPKNYDKNDGVLNSSLGNLFIPRDDIISFLCPLSVKLRKNIITLMSCISFSLLLWASMFIQRPL